MRIDVSTAGTPSNLEDSLHNLLGYLLRRASATMMSDLGSSLVPAGLRPTEATILILIRSNPGCRQSDLGRALGIARANMTPLMAGLMKQGLVEKSPVDGRSQALALTDKGLAKVIQVQNIIDAHEERFQSRFDAETRTMLLEALRTLQAG